MRFAIQVATYGATVGFVVYFTQWGLGDWRYWTLVALVGASIFVSKEDSND